MRDQQTCGAGSKMKDYAREGRTRVLESGRQARWFRLYTLIVGHLRSPIVTAAYCDAGGDEVATRFC